MEEAWAAVEAAASAFVSSSLEVALPSRLKAASAVLRSNDLSAVAFSYILDAVERNFAATLIPRFFEEFSQFNQWKRTLSSEDLELKVEGILKTQSHNLYRNFKYSSQLLEELCPSDTERNALAQQVRLSCLATIVNPPSTFQHALFCYFTRQFRLFRNAHEPKEELEPSEDVEMWEPEHFSALCLELRTLDIIAIADGVITEVIFDHIEAHLRDNYSENFEESKLKEVIAWATKVPLAWLQLAFGTATTTPQFRQLTVRVEFFVFEAFCSQRIAKMFDILIEFPQSSPTLEDLKECLSRTHQHEELITELTKTFGARLLHPAVATSMIIDQYIAVIKALRTVDPSGRILDSVAAPIRSYLSRREDAIRCIVSSLTDDANSELFEELQDGDTAAEPANDNDEDKDADPNWTPALLDGNAEHTQPAGLSRKVDIIGMLVSIYGSKELFVTEYKSMLAERLLNIFDYNTEREIRILELLKLRFGEGSMEQCEIMLRDMADSKRADTFIHQQINSTVPNATQEPCLVPSNFNATIVSPLFWPSFREEPLVLHPVVQQICDQYKAAYEKLKASRKLNWKPHLGTVEIELQREGGEPWSVSVTPIQATLALHFQDQSEWTLAALAEKVRAPVDVVKRRLRFWVNNGLLVQLPTGSYRISSETNSSTARTAADNEDTQQSNATNASEALWNQVKVIVLGMLGNFESGLTVEDIHRNLGFLVSDEFPFHKSVAELNTYLSRLVRDETSIAFSAGLYTARNE